MPDGTRLAARIWWPIDKPPFAAVVEYIPYRKRDLVRTRDERNHPYFAANGYVSMRVDMRGAGDSEGNMPDMYAAAELQDAIDVIEWIASQSWSSGEVGMFGTSWGGTASLQAACKAPEALKAVIANCATTNRFEDDIHWMGGNLLTDSFEWGATLPAILGAPPDLATVGSSWQSMWQERLSWLEFPLDAWIRNSVRGEYWRHGSVDFSREPIGCPALAIGGWSDRYSNTIMRLVQSQPELCWGIVGPWGHHYPDQGEPGPAVSFQKIALAWWDHWLAGKSDECLRWPRLRFWQREYDEPQNRLLQRNGKWIQTNDITESCKVEFTLSDQRLKAGTSSLETENENSFEIPNDVGHGECAGDTGYFGRTGGLPLEQSKDDQRSLCFDSLPLAEDITIAGHAELIVEIARDIADTQLVCRLCEVTAAGQSHLVVRQVQNLALDGMLDARAEFRIGECIRYKIRMPSTAYRFARGNRIRLALGTSYWPLVWPAPQAAVIKVIAHRSQLKLPSMKSAQTMAEPLPAAECLPVHPSCTTESEGELERECQVRRDGAVQMNWRLPRCSVRFADIETVISVATAAQYATDAAALSTRKFRLCIVYEIEIQRADGIANLQSEVTAEADHEALAVDANLTAYWKQDLIFEKKRQYVYSLPLQSKTAH